MFQNIIEFQLESTCSPTLRERESEKKMKSENTKLFRSWLISKSQATWKIVTLQFAYDLIDSMLRFCRFENNIYEICCFVACVCICLDFDRLHCFVWLMNREEKYESRMPWIELKMNWKCQTVLYIRTIVWPNHSLLCVNYWRMYLHGKCVSFSSHSPPKYQNYFDFLLLRIVRFRICLSIFMPSFNFDLFQFQI